MSTEVKTPSQEASMRQLSSDKTQGQESSMGKLTNDTEIPTLFLIFVVVILLIAALVSVGYLIYSFV